MLTNARPMRFSPEDIEIIERLGRIWGPVKPLGTTDVIREALRRCNEAETSKTSNAKPSHKETH